MTHLLINIDHIATLRNARRESFPDPVAGARHCLEGGADGIVFHLREDRRHINDDDVRRLKAELDTRLDFELSVARDIVGVACEVQPALATLVPEKREEITTEGGLDVAQNKSVLRDTISRLKDSGIAEVALFLDPEPSHIDLAAEIGATSVELHTGDYANAVRDEHRLRIIERMRAAAEQIHKNGMTVHAGHGLDMDNYPDFGKGVPHLAEVSIGFAIVARSIFTGIRQAVQDMKTVIHSTSYSG